MCPSTTAGADVDVFKDVTEFALLAGVLATAPTTGASKREPLLAVEVNGDGSMGAPCEAAANALESNWMDPRRLVKLPLLPPTTCSKGRFSIWSSSPRPTVVNWDNTLTIYTDHFINLQSLAQVLICLGRHTLVEDQGHAMKI